MSAQDWINTALEGKPVWNIGQIDKLTKRAFEKMVRQGKLEKSRLHWCGLNEKTVYHLPGLIINGF